MSNSDTKQDEFVVAFNSRSIQLGGWYMLAISNVGIGVTYLRFTRDFAGTLSTVGIGGLLSKPASFLISALEPYAITIVSAIACGIFGIIILQRRKYPLVVLSSAGIAVRLGYLNIERLAWDEIASIQTMYAGGSRSVCILPCDPDTIMRRLKWWHRWHYWQVMIAVRSAKRRGVFDAPIRVPQRLMHISVDELIEHIRGFQLRYNPTGPLAGDDPAADPAAWPPAPGRQQAQKDTATSVPELSQTKK